MINPLQRLSVQSKLILMLLGVSVGSIVVVSTLGYQSGKAAVTGSVVDQLTSLRAAKASQVTALMGRIRNQSIATSQNLMVVGAMREMRAACDELDKVPVPPDHDKAVLGFYRDQFLPKLAGHVDGEPVPAHYIPKPAWSRHLQYHYLAANPNPVGEKWKLDDAGDGSRYSGVHAKYHPVLRDYAQRFGYYDLFLIDARNSQVVYSVFKEPDYATDLLGGPYSTSFLGQIVRSLLRTGEKNAFRITDFEPYRPSLGAPAAFVASPIFDGPEMIGILALQFPLDEFNAVMTNKQGWEKDGLGKTGEVYLVGDDHLLRSMSRFLVQDPEGYFAGLERAGVDPARVGRIRRTNQAILTQEVRSLAVERALLGKEGTDFIRDYRDEPVISSYAPLPLDGLRWVIVAEKDLSEAFAPLAEFRTKVLACTVIIIVVITSLAAILARLFVRPIHRLIDGARRIGLGETDVVVDVTSRDEIRVLADSFNEMSRGLRSKSEEIERRIRENEELLLNVLPTPIAARMREGGQKISDAFADVTVLFAEVFGFEEATLEMSPGDAAEVLNDLISAFDDAAEARGVEKVKTMGSSYLAACGLSVPRLDHAHRVVEFAQDVLRVVRRFQRDRGLAIHVHAGINTGPVIGGIVGRSKFIYDLWGDTVNVARSLRIGGEGDAIHVTQAVYDRLKDGYEFEPLDAVEVKGRGAVPIWRATV